MVGVLVVGLGGIGCKGVDKWIYQTSDGQPQQGNHLYPGLKSNRNSQIY